MDIHNLTTEEVDNDFYRGDLRNVLEDHLTYFRTHPNVGVLELEPALVYKYIYDLYGLLKYKNVPPQYHWLIMRMNLMSNPYEMPENLTTLLIPPYQEVELIKNTFKTNKK
jgi:hypothetical protein